MTLKGQLQHFGLGELFQTLALNQHTGSLIIERADETKIIYFSSGSISLFSTGRAVRLGEILLRQGKVTEEQIQQALEDQRATGKLLGRILQERGIVTARDIELALSRKIEEELYELFFWEEGSFEFRPNYCPEDLMDPLQRHTHINIDPQRVIVEGLRQLDEWKLIRTRIPDTRMAIRKVTEALPPNANLEEMTLAVWSRLPGQISIESFMDSSPTTRFQTVRHIYHLLDEGWLRTLTAAEHCELAAGFREEERYEEAADLYEILNEAFEEIHGDADFLEDSGFFLLDRGRRDLALSFLETAVEIQRDADRLDRAWQIGSRLLERKESLPLQTLTVIWSVRKPASTRSLVVLRDAYLHALAANSEFLEIEAILADLEREQGNKSHYWAQRGDVQKELGHPDEAVAHYEKALSLLSKSNLEERIRLSRLIFDVEPSRHDMKEQVQTLLLRQEAKETRKRRHFTAVGIVAIAALLGATYPLNYELSSRKLYERAKALETAYGGEESRKEASQIYRQIVSDYPRSTRASAASEALGRLEAVARANRVRHQRELSDEQAREREARKAAMKRVVEMTEASEAALAEGKLEEVRRLNETLLRQYTHLVDVARIRYPLEIRTNPPGSELLLDGQEVGTTPYVHLYVPGSSFKLEVARQGCVSRSLQFTDNGEVRLLMALERTHLASFSFPEATDGLTHTTGRALIVPCRDGFVYSIPFMETEGTSQWQARAGGYGHPCAWVRQVDRTLITVSVTGRVQALRESGDEIWSRSWPEVISAAPVVSRDGRWLVVGDDSGRVTVLTVESGETVAAQKMEFPVAHVGFRYGRVIAVDRGRRYREFNVGSVLPADERLLESGVALITEEGALLYDSGRFESEGGVEQWPAPVTRVVERQGVIAYGAADRSWVIHSESGHLTGQLAVAPTCAPLQMGRYVYIGGDDSALYCLDLDGKRIWTVPVDRPITDLQPHPSGNVLLLRQDGVFLIFECER